MNEPESRADPTPWLLAIVAAGLLGWCATGLSPAALLPSLAAAILLALAASLGAARASLGIAGPPELVSQP